MDPDVARVESAIEQAVRRGDFDDLPGSGRPLDLPESHDPDWWINQRLADGTIDRQALLPVVVLLRKEYEDRDATLAEMATERAARDYAEDFTRRVHEDRRRNPFQRMLAPAWEPDDAAARWRQVRSRRAPEPAPGPAEEPTEETAGPARRGWWPFGRRG